MLQIIEKIIYSTLPYISFTGISLLALAWFTYMRMDTVFNNKKSKLSFNKNDCIKYEALSNWWADVEFFTFKLYFIGMGLTIFGMPFCHSSSS